MGAIDKIKNVFKKKPAELPPGPPPAPDLTELPKDEYVIVNGVPQKRINKHRLRDMVGSSRKIEQMIKEKREQLRKEKQ